MVQETVAVIGTGLIGCGWAAYYAAHGYDVRIFDVRDDYERAALDKIQAQIAEMPSSGVAEAIKRVSCFSTIAAALEGVDLVQENGPEKPDLKQALFADLEKFSPADALLVSSSSGLPPEIIGAAMQAPERAMIGHPINPPHLLPVVEVCAAAGASEGQVARLMDFYRRADRVAVRLKKPIAGFVINRLQAALVREAIHIVEEGVVDIKELDELMTSSLGVRWASIGPFLTGQLGGGEGGLRGITEHILSSLFAAMKLPPVSTQMLELLDQQAGENYPMPRIGGFARTRDIRQLEILDIQQRNPLPSPD